MRLNRLISSLLAAALLAGLLFCAPASAAGSAAFTDITDPAVAEAAEMLRLLGVVNGTGGTAFNPGGTLTRAEFCKMTVEIMGRGDEEPGQRNRTIFTDVGPTHWARGYVNLAASITIGGSTGEDGASSGGTRLIMGVGDGTFRPDQVITYGEAAAILLRVLGYSNADVATGGNWYDGYVTVAASAGLSDGLSLSGGSTITRGQAALLFYNLLFAKPKGSTELYMTTLGCKEADGGILLDVDATAPDGTAGAVKTTTGTYKTDRAGGLDEALEGMQGDLILNEDGMLLAFQPKENVTSRAVSVSEWAYNKVRLTGGEELEVDPKAVTYLDGEKKVYEELWQDLKPGTPATFYYTADGKIDYLFLRTTATAASAMVARTAPSGGVNPFAVLAGGDTGYQLYKNGVPATVSDIRQFDVATYDSASKVMNVSDLRLTGMYENVYPNTDTPARIKVMGVELNVLSSAAQDLSHFSIGDVITVLLTRDGQVAGVVDPSTARSTAVGCVEKIDESGNATVKLLNDVLPALEGKTSYRGETATKLTGELVTVSSYEVGQLSLTRLNSSGASGGALDVAGRTLGGTALAENVVVYERMGNGPLAAVDYEQITCASVPASKILYASKDYAGRYNVLVLNDVTGDQYYYGFLTTDTEPADSLSTPLYNPVINLNTSAKDATTKFMGTLNIRQNTPGGVAPSLETVNGSPKLAGYMSLNKLEGVRRSEFDMQNKVLTSGGMVLPISEQVVCYNASTKLWFTGDTAMDTLNQARAYSDNMTVYYDRTPSEGGKVRLVVVE